MTRLVQTRHAFEVTQADLDQARARDSGRCAVATALARSLPEAHHFLVDLKSIRYTQGEERFIYATPDKVSQYVLDFDAGIDKTQPMRFTLKNAIAKPIERRPGIGGRPLGSKTKRTPPLVGGSRKRTYGSRTLILNNLPEAHRV